MEKYINISGYYTDSDGFLNIGGRTNVSIGENIIISLGENNYSFNINNQNSQNKGSYRLFNVKTKQVENNENLLLHASFEDFSTVEYSVYTKLKSYIVNIKQIYKLSNGMLKVSGISNVDDENQKILISVYSNGIVVDELYTTSSEGIWSISTNKAINNGDYVVVASFETNDFQNRFQGKDLKNISINNDAEYVRFLSHKMNTTNNQPTIYGTVGVSKVDGRGYDVKNIIETINVQIIDNQLNVIEEFNVSTDTKGQWQVTPSLPLNEGTYIVKSKTIKSDLVGYGKKYIESFSDLELQINSLENQNNQFGLNHTVYETNIVATDDARFYREDELVFQDAMTRITSDSKNRDGWYYKNQRTSSYETNDKKINWYLFDQYSISEVKFSDLKYVYAKMDLDLNSSMPFFAVYTKPNGGTSNGDGSSWFRLARSYSLQSNIDGTIKSIPETNFEGKYLMYVSNTGTVDDKTNDGYLSIRYTYDINSSTNRGAIVGGIKVDDVDGEILTIALNTDSGKSQNGYSFVVEEMGFETQDGTMFVLYLNKSGEEYVVDTTDPQSPTDILISEISEDSFVVSWSQNLDYGTNILYDIYLKTGSGSYVYMGETEYNQYTFNGLASSTTYHVKIKAKDERGNYSIPVFYNNIQTT